ncbi:hypothetical protein [Coleofasciculus sp.]|uniref:hypothetical protein n=1 Tax=Coleofasciculus sp. TaxID=3100458 RepID=UPI003A453B02
MTVQLSQPEYRRVTPIVQRLADFATARDRTDLVVEVLANIRQVNSILAQLGMGSEQDAKPAAWLR